MGRIGTAVSAVWPRAYAEPHQDKSDALLFTGKSGVACRLLPCWMKCF
jgi:hypothetical protein